MKKIESFGMEITNRSPPDPLRTRPDDDCEADVLRFDINVDASDGGGGGGRLDLATRTSSPRFRPFVAFFKLSTA